MRTAVAFNGKLAGLSLLAWVRIHMTGVDRAMTEMFMTTPSAPWTRGHPERGPLAIVIGCQCLA